MLVCRTCGTEGRINRHWQLLPCGCGSSVFLLTAKLSAEQTDHRDAALVLSDFDRQFLHDLRITSAEVSA